MNLSKGHFSLSKDDMTQAIKITAGSFHSFMVVEALGLQFSSCKPAGLFFN